MSKISRDQLYDHKATHDKQNSWWLRDAKGIELCRVCDDCIEVVESTYAPEVLGKCGSYEDVVEECIEPDYPDYGDSYE